MRKIILVLLGIILYVVNFAQVAEKMNSNVPVIKKLWFNKVENSFYWVLINKKDTIKIIKTYDGGTELKNGRMFSNNKLDFITYELEDFGSGVETTIFFDKKEQKFYSVRYNLNGLENEKLVFLTVDFKMKKIMIEIKTNGKKSGNNKIGKLNELPTLSRNTHKVSF